MAEVSITLTGQKELEEALRSIAAGALPATQAALHRFAEEVITDSKENYVPYRTGVLAGSGFVRDEMEAQAAQVSLGYGGAAAPYAIAVHENPRSGQTGGVSPSGRKYPEAPMDKSYARRGQWKYLETPLKLRSPAMGQALRDALDKLAEDKAYHEGRVNVREDVE